MDVRIVDIASREDAERQIRSTGADPGSVPYMAPKALLRAVLVKSLDNRGANILKQELLSIGGEAAVSRSIGAFRKGSSPALLLATERQYRTLVRKLSGQPFGLKALAERITSALSHYDRTSFVVDCGGKKLRLGRSPVVMGILNVTPDSFSDGGVHFDTGRAVAHARDMVSAGAGIIDVGGESSRPGSAPVSAREEIARVVPVIGKLAAAVKTPISIDTCKPDVARAALDAGASLVNDITGLRHRKGAMAKVVREYGVPVIVMHMQGVPRTMQKDPRYGDVIDDIGGFFLRRIEFAAECGVKESQLILDPGIGFGKTPEHNLEILRRLREFKVLGRPLAIGTSRKYFIGALLGGVPPGERTAGSVASAVWSALNGAHIVRVHDVRETVQALKIIQAVRGLPWN